MERQNIIKEDNTYVIHGPKSREPVSNEPVGKELIRIFQNIPNDSIAMIDAFTQERLLFSDLFQKCINLAAALRHHGYFGQNTVLVICSENSLNFFLPVYASMYNGSILAPINHMYTPYEMRHALNIIKPKVIFCSEAVLAKIIELKKIFGFIERIIVLENCKRSDEAVETMDDFVYSSLKGENAAVSTLRLVEGNPAEMAAFIMTSSGTTGLPKGVLLSHQSLNVRLIHSRDSRFQSDSPTSPFVLCFLPFFHAYGLLKTFSDFANGYTVISMNRFDVDVFLKTIQDYRISSLTLAPPLMILLAKSPKLENYDLSSVKHIFSAAAPLSKNTEEEVRKRLNNSIIGQGYGLTEVTLAATLMPPDDVRPGSCGKLLPLLSIKIRDPETGQSLGPNKVGEICLKGPSVMMGYYKNEQATKETSTSDGWLKTGDLGYYDEEEYFYIVDRLKELIKFKGYQVAPAELESMLINHPKINDAGVVGLPDKLVGEKPLAFVVKKTGADISEAEIKRFIAGLVSPQKRLTGGVIFLDAIPKNPSGKILRKELRKMLEILLTSKL